MDLGYDDVSPMIHMKASQILYSAKAKPVSEIYNKSSKKWHLLMQRLSVYENVRGFTAKLMHTLHLMLTLFVYMYS